MKEITNAFNDITMMPSNNFADALPLGFYPANNAETTQLGHMQQLQVGEGDKTFKIDQQGMWLGNNLFENAPWRINMEGEMIFNDGTNDRIIISPNG